MQAYAELEKDTPGQIFGVAFKSDGKSSEDENLSEKFTQGVGIEENKYEEEPDHKDTVDYHREQKSNKFWFGVGFVMVIFLIGMSMAEKTSEENHYKFRDYTLEKQRLKREKEEQEGFEDA